MTTDPDLEFDTPRCSICDEHTSVEDDIFWCDICGVRWALSGRFGEAEPDHPMRGSGSADRAVSGSSQDGNNSRHTGSRDAPYDEGLTSPGQQVPGGNRSRLEPEVKPGGRRTQVPGGNPAASHSGS